MYTVQTPHGLFRYNHDAHEYYLDDVRLENNTSILENVGITDFSMVPPETLKQAQLRGRAVHAAVQYLEDGVLDWNTLHPKIADYTKQYQKWRTMTDFKPILVERPMFSKIWGYGTTIDLLGQFRERWAIVEIKSGVDAVESGKIQTAGQMLTFPEMRWDLPPGCPDNPDRYVLELRPEKFKLNGPFLQTDYDLAVFKSAVWINRHLKKIRR